MPRDNVQIGMGHTSLKHKIDMYFAGIGMGFNPGPFRRDRMHQIITLETATDTELAGLGLRREDILSYVFRDLLGA